MPIFQEESGSPPSPLRPPLATSELRLHQLRKDHVYNATKCEQLKRFKAQKFPTRHTEQDSPAETTTSHNTSDRGEFVEWLSNNDTPFWATSIPNASPIYPRFSTTPTEQLPSSYLSLLPSPSFSEAVHADEDVDRNRTGSQIERPRSALHSGDFTESRDHHSNQEASNPLSNRQPEFSSWQATSPPRSFAILRNESRAESTPLPIHRYRAPSVSSSLSSSFVFKPPTSPLVQSESNNDDSDFSSYMAPIDIDTRFTRNNRRHTLHATQFSSSLFSSPSVGSRPPPQLRRDNTFPYQAHQPRRSLTSNSLSQPSSNSHTPLSRSRRPSFSEGSPLHASMVGSYEESILRGRMSTTPSKPLDFLAQIGVLGLGKCKSSLKCPPHVTIPFPAVFYSYDTTTHGRLSRSNDEPSPYVGQIDLENNLPHPARRKRAVANNLTHNSEDRAASLERSHDLTIDKNVHNTLKRRKRSLSPRAPAGGSYRIPEKGQLQIIIKNPNKTAVKLFLIQYDLAGMEPGTKTFIRQRSYSVGPIIDIPTARSSTADRPVLRYLVHLHICSPSKGRFYLYKSIRIVFANRVPDGKEKLRNEISLPEPRFTAYKPGREQPLSGPSNTSANVAAEIARRRRSGGFSLSHANHFHDDYSSLLKTPERITTTTNFNSVYGYEMSPIQPIPFKSEKKSSLVGVDPDSKLPLHSPSSSRSSRPTTTSSQSDNAISWDTNEISLESYNKLKKGDAGYGGFAFSDNAFGRNVGEGLLAQKLKDLGVQHQ